MLDAVLADFTAEAQELGSLLSTLREEDWFKPTPAEGWDVRDSVAHLAVSDEMALECVVDDRVPALMAEGMEAMLAGGDALEAFGTKMLDLGRDLDPLDVLAWWRESNANLLAALADVDPERRLHWGPNQMSPTSFITARLMETWAHGLDCFDAVGYSPPDTDRLRHIAELSVRALPYAFMIKGKPAPGPVRLDLTAPSGAHWVIGPEDASTVVTATASDWCRVATHRDRRRERSRVQAVGPDAADVLESVQAYL